VAATNALTEDRAGVVHGDSKLEWGLG
jgi:hypothetical protein